MCVCVCMCVYVCVCVYGGGVAGGGLVVQSLLQRETAKSRGSCGRTVGKARRDETEWSLELSPSVFRTFYNC